jgi:hypothetical protein
VTKERNQLVETCLSGDECPEEAVSSTTFPERRMFCEKHQRRLDEIREHLEDKAWSNNIRNKEGINISFCNTSGCDNRPLHGGEFCAYCSGGDF